MIRSKWERQNSRKYATNKRSHEDEGEAILQQVDGSVHYLARTQVAKREPRGRPTTTLGSKSWQNRMWFFLKNKKPKLTAKFGGKSLHEKATH